MPERLQKYLARCGVASRRHAENLIVQGRVTVNEKTVTVLGSKVDSARDKVAFDGTVVTPPDALTYLAMYKPPGNLTTRNDPYNRPTVYDLLPAHFAQLVPVGRLDYQSEGLLFLTNDGAWAQRVAHPRHGGEKEYLVLVNGRVTPQRIADLQAPMTIDGYRLNPVSVRLLEREGRGTWIAMTLTEGRKRQIRHMLAAIGKRAERLVRIRIGVVRLGDLEPGNYRPLEAKEVEHWRESAGSDTPLVEESRPSISPSAAISGRVPKKRSPEPYPANTAVGLRSHDRT
jgi:23S rRNA pseudouridine2605 synthase